MPLNRHFSPFFTYPTVKKRDIITSIYSIVELDDEITLSYKKVWYNDADKEIQI